MNVRSSILAVSASFGALLLLANCSAENTVVNNTGGSSTTGGSAVAGSAAGSLAGSGGSGVAGSGVAGSSVAGSGVGGSGLGGSGVAGSGVAGSGVAGGAAGAATASFGTLRNIIQMSCFGGICHDLPEHPLQLKVDDKLYATLTTHQTKDCGPLMKPGSPQESAIVKLLKGPCGKTARMPLDKCSQDGDEACVTPANIALIEQWIANGAPQ